MALIVYNAPSSNNYTSSFFVELIGTYLPLSKHGTYHNILGLGFKPRRGGFPSGAKKEWGLSLKSKVRVLHNAQLDVSVQTKVATKQSRFKELLACADGIQEDIDLAKERYKAAKREAKIAVARAKDKPYEDLYKKLVSKEGANDIYKIAKARERERRDIENVRYIKDEGGRTIVREEDIRKRWGEYFSSLFNGSTPIESRPEKSGKIGSSRQQMHYDCYYSRINQKEVKDALQRMERNKAVGPDQIPIEAWRCLEDEGVKWRTCLFNMIFLSTKMPDEWRLSEVILI
nr:hypothetical protein [Tanacetum cinerariifolium]